MTASIVGPHTDAVWLSKEIVVASEVAKKPNDFCVQPMLTRLWPAVSKLQASVRPGAEVAIAFTVGAQPGLPAIMKATE